MEVDPVAAEFIYATLHDSKALNQDDLLKRLLGCNNINKTPHRVLNRFHDGLQALCVTGHITEVRPGYYALWNHNFHLALALNRVADELRLLREEL